LFREDDFWREEEGVLSVSDAGDLASGGVFMKFVVGGSEGCREDKEPMGITFVRDG